MENTAEVTKTTEEFQFEISTLQNEYAALKQDHAELQAKYEWLLEQIRLSKQKLYGRKREAVQTENQISMMELFAELFNEPEVLVEENAQLEPTVEEIQVSYKRKKYPGQRTDILEGLPVERIDYELPENERICEACGNSIHEMSIEVTRQLKIVPAQVVVVEHVRHIYSCRNCENTGTSATIAKAPMPKPTIPHSIASESAIAYVITQKYQFGLPLYRQEQQWKMLGIQISRQTMANWVIDSSERWLTLIYNRMRQYLLERDIIHADESVLQVLKEPGRPATSNSYMWLYRTGRDGPPIILFNYQTTHASKHPTTFLSGFKGYLNTDGYAGYNNLPDVINIACFCHARRKFVDALKAMPKNTSGKPCAAEEGLAFCDKLFEIERSLKDKSDKERYKERLKTSKPILDKFYEWLKYQKPRVTPKSSLGVAVNYCLNLWEKLTGFLKDGRLEIHNNRSERSIKSFVIGRKGFLFANTPKGATASAVAYSIVETAKENGLKPFEYLSYILAALPNLDFNDQTTLDSILPWSTELPDHCRLKPTM